jgi:hypothetical protein
MGVLDFRRATQILDVVFDDLGERLPFKLPSFLLGLTVARSRDPLHPRTATPTRRALLS